MYSQFSCDYDDFHFCWIFFLEKKKLITHIYTQRLQSQKISSFCKLRKCKGQHGHHFIMILIAFQAKAPSKRRNDAQSKYIAILLDLLVVRYSNICLFSKNAHTFHIEVFSCGREDFISVMVRSSLISLSPISIYFF